MFQDRPFSAWALKIRFWSCNLCSRCAKFYCVLQLGLCRSQWNGCVKLLCFAAVLHMGSSLKGWGTHLSESLGVAVNTLPPNWDGIEGDGVAAASCLAFSAESTNCCDSLKRFLASRNFREEAQIGCLSWCNRRSASANPCALALFTSSCGIAPHESWSVSAEAALYSAEE